MHLLNEIGELSIKRMSHETMIHAVDTVKGTIRERSGEIKGVNNLT